MTMPWKENNIQIKNLTIDFPQLKLEDFEPIPDGLTGADFSPRTTPDVGLGIEEGSGLDEIEFDTPPTQVTAILTGYKIGFEKPVDHHLGNLEIRIGEPIKLTDTRYRIPITFGLRDWTDDWNDRHGGKIHIAVIGV
jgi:hypothetical protein